MRYLLISLGLLLLIGLMVGNTSFKAKSEQKAELKNPNGSAMVFSGNEGLSGKQAIGLMNCQAMHDQIRKQTNYSDLYHTSQNKNQTQNCPVISNAAYQALQ